MKERKLYLRAGGEYRTRCGHKARITGGSGNWWHGVVIDDEDREIPETWEIQEFAIRAVGDIFHDILSESIN